MTDAPWTEPLPGLLRQSLDGQENYFGSLVVEMTTAVKNDRHLHVDVDEWERSVDKLVEVSTHLGGIVALRKHDDNLRRNLVEV